MNASPPTALKSLPAQPIKLYRALISGHAHRVELFLSLLGLPFEAVEVDLAAGPLAFGPAAARVIQLFRLPANPQDAIARAHALFRVMEQQLGQSAFLAGSAPTLADVANYSYAARAPEGHVSLADYPNLRAWLARVEALPRFAPMVQTPVGLSA